MAETSATASMQDQVLETLRTGQEASVGIVRSWAETMASLTRPVATANIDNFVRFSQQFFDMERQYAIRMLEALEPVAGVDVPRPRSTSGKASS